MTNNIEVESKRRRVITYITHAIVIVIICILPEMLMRMSSPMRSTTESWWLYSKSWVMIAVFYINYFIIIDKTLVGRQHGRVYFFLWNILLIMAASALTSYLNDLGIASRRGPRHMPTPNHWQIILTQLSFVLRDGIMLLLTVSLAVVLRLSHKWVEMERRQQQLIVAHRESELENLRVQLSPHFLFNTLNSIYALIEISPKEAQQTVHKLSQMLRYVVYENPEHVELSQEIDFVKNYIDLMKLRMPERPIEITIENTASGNTPIAPLLFVSLTENAFKHGNTPDISNPIKIHILANDKKIEFSTENNTRTLPSLDESHGVGLTNLKRRIELIYNKNASLNTSLSDGIFRATLRINLCKNSDA